MKIYSNRGWRFFILCFFISFFVNDIHTQNITSTVRGTVYDATNHDPLIGATLYFSNALDSIGTSTDEYGSFLVENIGIGHFQLKVRYLGYEELTVAEVFIEAGKETVLEVPLRASTSDLGAVIVKALDKGNTSINSLSNYTLTVEETERFPATFYDPARLISSYPGVVNTNDQANNISVRGLPPSLMQWRLEGVEIVNPNHLSNAGTLSDQPTQAGGGVNILSAQMLDNSRFFSGAFPVEFNNAIGGVMDMEFKTGNQEDHEFTAQAGLLGFDLGMEGPLSAKNKSSFAFNYRYSFTGLLTNFGVDFGGEEIAFQDVAFNLNFPLRNGGRVEVIGMGGFSSNVFNAKPMEEWEIEKDLKDIEFLSGMGAVGLIHESPVGRKGWVKNVLMYSTLRHEREESSPGFTVPKFENNVSKLALASNWTFKLSEKERFKLGTQIYSDLYEDIIGDPSIDGLGIEKELFSFFPYLDYTIELSNKFSLEVGTNIAIRQIQPGFNTTIIIDEFEEQTAVSFNPRASLKYQIDKSKSFSYFIGKQSFNILHSDINFSGIFDMNVEHFSQSLQQVLQFKNYFQNQSLFQIELFHNNLSELPYNLGDVPFFNFDVPSLLVFPESFNGKARTYGLETLFQYFINNGTYGLISGTLYKSQYKTPSTEWLDSRFNGGYALSLTGGKEFRKAKKEKIRVFGVNVKAVLAGGLREREIDVAASIENDFQVFVFDNTFSQQLKDYFRADLRLYWKWHKAKNNAILSLDIQNVTGQQNVAFNYYDSFANTILTKDQLSLIPVLNYRLEF